MKILDFLQLNGNSKNVAKDRLKSLLENDRQKAQDLTMEHLTEEVSLILSQCLDVDKDKIRIEHYTKEKHGEDSVVIKIPYEEFN